MSETLTNERATRLCAFCPSLCRFACPVEEAEAREAASPRFMVGLGHHLEVGMLPWGPEVAEAFTFCDGCGACTRICEHQVPVREVLQVHRRNARARGFVPPAHASIEAALRRHRGPGGGELTPHFLGVRPERQGRAAPLLLWPSDRCLEQGPETLLATCEFLEALGVDYALPRPRDLLPAPRWARVIGAEELSRDLAHQLRELWDGYPEVLLEEPGDEEALLGPPSRRRTLADLAPGPDLELPGGGPPPLLACPEQAPEAVGHLVGHLGLSPLERPDGLALSPGCGDLIDLVQPELAARLLRGFLVALAGRRVLTWSPHLAFHLERAGAVALRIAALRPREQP